MRALVPHIHMAALGQDVVLLDVRADAYHCIPGGAAVLRPSPDRASVAPASPEAAAALEAAGLLAERVTKRTVLPRPVRDLDIPSPEAVRLRDLLRLAGALVDLQVRYRPRPIGAILDDVTRAAPRAQNGSADAEVRRLARIFARLVVWLPMERKCLARSFVLLRFLQRSGVNAAWVFGVRTWPFGAHCWLQLGDLVLDDTADRLAVFEPILAVG